MQDLITIPSHGIRYPNIIVLFAVSNRDLFAWESPINYPFITSCRGRATTLKLILDKRAVAHFPFAKGLVINYGEGGATKWENRGSETFCTPPLKTEQNFSRHPFKEWKLFASPINMSKTSSYSVKTTPKLFVPPLQHSLKSFRPPFSRGKTSRAPPSRFVAPPSP